jgi:hypothetical protein
MFRNTSYATRYDLTGGARCHLENTTPCAIAEPLQPCGEVRLSKSKATIDGECAGFRIESER